MDKVNKQELRRMAECASSGPWLAEMEGGRMNVANEDWYLLEMHHDQPLFMTDAAFVAAANPAAILSLLDELERLEANHNQLNHGVAVAATSEWNRLAEENDQLRTELEQCRKDAQRWQCVRNAILMQSPYAVWREGAHVVLGKDADELVDNFLAAKEGGANG